MATNPKRSTTKSVGNPCVSSFQFRGQKYVVEMIDPLITRNKNGGLNIPVVNFGTYSGGRKVVTATHIKMVDVDYTPPTWATIFEMPDAKNKDKVLNGFYCPATYRVTGYLYDMTFTTGVKSTSKARTKKLESRVVVNSITIQSQSGKDTEPVTRDLIGRIPVALLLESALKASQFTGRYTDQFSPIQNFEIVKLGYQLAIKDVDNFLGRKRRGQPKADDTALSDKSVKEYARHWHACPANYPGGKDAYIANNMVMSDNSPMYNVSTRNRQLRRARDTKLIPPVPQRYKYKRKSKKRVTK
jgi:hypothetical protein